jgi:hypothetical protein
MISVIKVYNFRSQQKFIDFFTPNITYLRKKNFTSPSMVLFNFFHTNANLKAKPSNIEIAFSITVLEIFPVQKYRMHLKLLHPYCPCVKAAGGPSFLREVNSCMLSKYLLFKSTRRVNLQEQNSSEIPNGFTLIDC